MHFRIYTLLFYKCLLWFFIFKIFSQEISAGVVTVGVKGDQHNIYDSTGSSNRIFLIEEGAGGSLTLKNGVFDARDLEGNDTALIFPHNPADPTKIITDYTINLAGTAISSVSQPVIDLGFGNVKGTINLINGYINPELSGLTPGSLIYKTFRLQDQVEQFPPCNYGPTINFKSSSAKLNFIQTSVSSNKIHGDLYGSDNGDIITFNGGSLYGKIVLGNGDNNLTICNDSVVDLSKGFMVDEPAIVVQGGNNVINISDQAKIIPGKDKDVIYSKINSPNAVAGGITTVNLKGEPQILGGINLPVNKNVLNIGSSKAAANYVTQGDLKNLQIIELNSPINDQTLFKVNHDVSGVNKLNVRYNTKVEVAGGHIQGIEGNNDNEIINSGYVSLDNLATIYGVKFSNNRLIYLAGHSSVLFQEKFDNRGELIISQGGDLAAINPNVDALTNNYGNTITISQDASMGKLGPLGTLTNAGELKLDGTLYADNIVNQADARIKLSSEATCTLSGTGVLDNSGMLTLPEGAKINAKTIKQNNDLLIEGTINAAMVLGGDGINLRINAGKVNAITSSNNKDVLEILGPFSTNGEIKQLQNIKVLTGTVILKDVVSGVEKSFAVYPQAEINLEDYGEISGGGSIDNFGIINLRQGKNFGSIGLATPMGKINNQGTINMFGGNLNATDLTNNDRVAGLNIYGGKAVVTNFNNILGSLNMQGGDLSVKAASSNADTGAGQTSGILKNSTNQVVNLTNNATIGDFQEFGQIINYGVFNLADLAIVKVNNFKNDRILSNNTSRVELNITGGQLLVGSNTQIDSNAASTTATAGTGTVGGGATTGATSAAGSTAGATAGGGGASGTGTVTNSGSTSKVTGGTGTVAEATSTTGATNAAGSTAGATAGTGVTSSTAATTSGGTTGTGAAASATVTSTGTSAAGSTATGILNNNFGVINLVNGDLSSLNPGNLTKLVNAKDQQIIISKNGTIGKTAALGAVTNYGQFMANGSDVIVGDFTNGDGTNNYYGELTLTRGIFRVGNIQNNLGVIRLLHYTADGETFSPDLSSAVSIQPSTLINAKNQLIDLQAGTIGVKSPLGAVTNQGIMQLNNDVNIGALTNSLNAAITITGGVIKAGDLTNEGTITLEGQGGKIADLASINPEQPSNLTNAAGKIINILGSSTMGAVNPLGKITNQGIINANAAEIFIGELFQGNLNVAEPDIQLNLSSGNIFAGNITNNKNNVIKIEGGDLSSFNPIKHSNLINRGGKISITNDGSIGNFAQSSLGSVSNYDDATFEANGGPIKLDAFINGFDGSAAKLSNSAGDLSIRNGACIIGDLSNIYGKVAITGGDLSAMRPYNGKISNGADQSIVVSSLGNIGFNAPYKELFNAGEVTINADQIDLGLNIGSFINDGATAQLNLIQGSLKVISIENNLGVITLGAGSDNGSKIAADLSSAPNTSATLTNKAEIIINLPGTVGKTNEFGSIDNYGKIEAKTNFIKAGNLNNHGKFALINYDKIFPDPTVANPNNKIKFNAINNYSQLELKSNNKLNPIATGKIHNLSNATLNIESNLEITGGLINDPTGIINLKGDLKLTKPGVPGPSVDPQDLWLNQGIVQVLKPVLIEQGNYYLASTGEHIVSLQHGLIPELTLMQGGATIANGATIKFNNPHDEFIQDQQEFNLIKMGSLLNRIVIDDLKSIKVKGNTSLLYYELVNNGNVLNLKANRRKIYDLIDPEHAYISDLALSLDRLFMDEVAYQKPEVKTVLSNLEELATDQEVVAAVSQLSPDLDLPEISVLANNFVATAAMTERVEFLARSNFIHPNTGYNAGSMEVRDGLWVKGLGSSIKQSSRYNYPGYNVTTGGISLGLDTQFLRNFWLGLGFSKVFSLMKTKEYPTRRNSVDSYQITSYASFNRSSYYVDLFGSIGFNNYKTRREILFSTPTQIATAKFKGVLPAAKIAAGYIYPLNNLKVIPQVSLQYSVLFQNPYNEDPVAIVGLNKISSDRLTQLEGGAGMKLVLLEDYDPSITYNYTVYGMLLHDFKAAPRITTAEFIAGGGTFKLPGAPAAPNTYNLGVSLDVTYNHNLKFTCNYDLRKKTKFIAHSGSVTVRYDL